MIGKYLLLFIAVPLALAELSRKFLIRIIGVEGFQRTKLRIKTMEKFGLMLMLFILFVLNGKKVFESSLLIPKVMLPAVAFLLTLLCTSKLISSIWRMRAEDEAAFIFCTTAKNNALAMALAFTVFGSQVALVNAIRGGIYD